MKDERCREEGVNEGLAQRYIHYLYWFTECAVKQFPGLYLGFF